jgi:hypothetical protein
LNPAERLAIYSDAYFLRLEECLAEDFKAVRHLLGHADFHRLVAAYLAVYPSKHYSLNGLGKKLPEFLNGPIRLPHKELVRNLARLEWAMSSLVDSVEPPTSPPDALSRLTPETIVGARFRMNPTLTLLKFSVPANAIVTAVRMEKPLPPLNRRPTWLVVYRKDFAVWRMDLSEAMFGLLHGLSRGRTFGHVLKEVQRRWKGTPQELEVAIFKSLRNWMAERFFTSFTIGRK